MAHKTDPFLVYFSKTVSPVRVVNKRKSPIMQMIAFFLSILTKMKLVKFSKDDFMDNYVTTIGRTIYAGRDWSMDMQPNRAVLHELVHVLQFRRFWMELQYLVSKKWRSYYESSADQAWMIIYPDYTTSTVLEQKAVGYTRYGIPHAMILDDLKDRRKGVTVGVYQPEARKVAFNFNEWRYLCLNNLNMAKREK